MARPPNCSLLRNICSFIFKENLDGIVLTSLFASCFYDSSYFLCICFAKKHIYLNYYQTFSSTSNKMNHSHVWLCFCVSHVFLCDAPTLLFTTFFTWTIRWSFCPPLCFPSMPCSYALHVIGCIARPSKQYMSRAEGRSRLF